MSSGVLRTAHVLCESAYQAVTQTRYRVVTTCDGPNSHGEELGVARLTCALVSKVEGYRSSGELCSDFGVVSCIEIFSTGG